MNILFNHLPRLPWRGCCYRFLLINLFLILGCGNRENLTDLGQHLAGVYDYAKLSAQFCTTPPKPAKQKTKYLFILDHSSSNKPIINDSDASNTDPSGSRRYGTLVNFVDNMNTDPADETYFNLINFSTEASQMAGLCALPVCEFIKDRELFLSKVTVDWMGSSVDQQNPSPIDSGFTNYQKALNLARTIINDDATLEAASASQEMVTVSYRIIFVTDGMPVAVNEVTKQTYLQDFVKEIGPAIDNITNLKNNPLFIDHISGIILNTAYYYNSSASDTLKAQARELLTKMADRGNGIFREFGTGENIMFQQFSPPSRKVLNELVDIFIENKNGIWWDSGEFMLDSDSDGLPDLIETKLGSNPKAYDSDENDISDLVEYRLKGRPCNDLQCKKETHDPYMICTIFKNESTGSYNRSSNDGLNDCEKYILGAKKEAFNTNGDMIPDLFSLKNSLTIQAGMPSEAFADPFADGLSNYEKLKLGYPIQASKRNLGFFEGRQLLLQAKSSEFVDRTCYSFQADRIALASQHDTVRIYVVQNSSTIQDRPFMVSAERTMSSSLSIKLGVDDFK